MRLRLGRDAVLVSVMVYGEAGLTSVVLVSPMVLWSGSLPSRVLRHLCLEGPIPPGAVGWILALLGEGEAPLRSPQVSGRGGARRRAGSPGEGLVEALKGDSEGEDRGQAVVGCPRFAYWLRLLDAPTRLCRVCGPA